MPLESTEPADLSLSDQRWQARVDLAAAHRLAVMHGFNEGIFNHFTLRVPGPTTATTRSRSAALVRSHRQLLHGNRLRRDTLSGEGEIERSAYCIHAPIHRAAADAAAVFHTHMPFASALARLEDQSILPIGQTELGTMMHTAYDDIYTGPAFDPAEGERLAGVIGDKTVLMMANHGVATVGKTVAEAYDRLYYVERVAQVQLYAMWTGRPLKLLPQAVIDQTFSEARGVSIRRQTKPNGISTH